MKIELRLCDEEGLVSHAMADRIEGSVGDDETYIERLNRLKRDFSTKWPDTRYEGEPFSCSGSVTFIGVTVTCDNALHHPTVNENIILGTN